MAGPLEGIKVVEFGMWIAGPAAAAILGDWGADVVKIEPPTSDPFRGVMAALGAGELNPPFELDNRNKRSIGIDLSTAPGRKLAADLVAEADVFVSNVRLPALRRAGLDPETLLERHPRLVYALVTGYGLEGPDADRAAYDVGAFWSRAGVATALAPDGQPLPYQRGGMGDHMAGMAAAGAVSTALFSRERTGQGQLVSTSLLRIGMYMLGWDVSMAARVGVETRPVEVAAPPNPMITAYSASDGRRFWLLGLQGDRMWPDVLRAIDRPDLASDPRFAGTIERALYSRELCEVLGGIFSTRTFDEWTELFDREDVWWAPVQHAHDLLDDPQAEAGGGCVDVPAPDGSTVRGVASPVDFGGTPWEARSASPEYAQHTEEVCLELGLDWDRIIELKNAGVIP